MKSKKEVEIIEDPATGEGWTEMEDLRPEAFPTLRKLGPAGEACRNFFLDAVDNISSKRSCGNTGTFGGGLDRAGGCNKSPV